MLKEKEGGGDWNHSTFIAKVFSQHSVRLVVELNKIMGQIKESE